MINQNQFWVQHISTLVKHSKCTGTLELSPIAGNTKESTIPLVTNFRIIHAASSTTCSTSTNNNFKTIITIPQAMPNVSLLTNLKLSMKLGSSTMTPPQVGGNCSVLKFWIIFLHVNTWWWETTSNVHNTMCLFQPYLFYKLITNNVFIKIESI